MSFFITSQDRQTQVLAVDAMTTTIILIKMHDFRDHCYRQCSAASVCNYPSNNITVKYYLGAARLLQPKTKQSYIYQHGEYGLSAPNCPLPRFRARDLHGLLRLL